MTSAATLESWSATAQGMSSIDVTVQAAHPEFDGAVIARLIATRETDTVDPVTGALITRLVPLPDRVDSLIALTLAWARLRRLPAAQRRIAIVFHHHPPRNDRIGCASGLDSFESIRLLLRALADTGYDIPEHFATGDDLANRMLEAMTCDRRWLTPEAMHACSQAHADTPTVQSWHADLPPRVQDSMTAAWGVPPGELFAHNGELSFAGHLDGNVFLTIQPPRGQLEKITDEDIHQLVLPPPHHYLAHYRWIRDVFGAHAVIHGSLEWLPGKALGLSEECYPELALAELPNLYPYIINNPGEGTQAKRRSHAVVVDHIPPPMRNAELDDQTALVDRLAREYPEALARSAEAAAAVADTLWDAVEAADLQVDLEVDRENALADPDDFVHRVRHYLLDLSDNAISDGLHVLGRVAADPGSEPGLASDGLGPRQRIVDYLVQLTRLPNGDVPSLREAVMDCWGLDAPPPPGGPDTHAPQTAEAAKAAIDDVRQAHDTCRALVDAVYDEALAQLTPPTTTPESAVRTPATDAARQATIEILGRSHTGVERTLTYLIDDLVPRLADVRDELDAILTGLDGGFVPPGPSGAPTRGNADILPTGRNFFSLDPRTLPTPAAWKVGVALAEGLLARYRAENTDGQDYPRNIGIILWGTANMRSHGEDCRRDPAPVGAAPPMGHRRAGRRRRDRARGGAGPPPDRRHTAHLRFLPRRLPQPGRTPRRRRRAGRRAGRGRGTQLPTRPRPRRPARTSGGGSLRRRGVAARDAAGLRLPTRQLRRRRRGTHRDESLADEG